jgi:ferredoxin-NADP reductase/MOSC domain-containing protein YiiM
MAAAAKPETHRIVRALSVAMPKERIVYGKPVFTSIVRDPVEGPIYFGEHGPDNNKTAVHTEQVLAFSSEHYDYWTTALGIPRESWPWAFWGENITLDGLDELTLCVGDIVRAGDVVFEVTAPRTPCFKLSWRVGQTTDFLKRLNDSGLVGVYLRVVTPGTLRAGELVRVEATGKSAVTVAEVARMIADLHEQSLPRAREALAVRELGFMARTLLGHKVNFLEDAMRCRAHRWQGWRTFRIAALQREGRDAMSVALVAIDGGPIAPYRAGQHLTVRMPGDPPIVRTWSLSEFEPYPSRYRITVKRQAGPGSRWINDDARVGDIVEVRAPSGRFVLNRASFFRAVFISAGVGITPMLSMLRAHVLRGEEAPAIHWLHSAIDASSALHTGEVDDLLRRAVVATRQVHFTSPSERDLPGSHDRVGFILPQHLEEILRSPFPAAGGAVSVPGEHSHFYVCGPEPFNRMVIDTLESLGVEKDLIFTEKFAAAVSDRRPSSRTTPSRVRLERSNLDLEWDPEQGQSLLEFVEEAGVDAPFSCRSGNCGTCEVALLGGTVEYDPDPELVVGPSRCLTCCARPTSDQILLDL